MASVLGEPLRLAQLQVTRLLDTPRDPAFDAIVRLAAAALHAPGGSLTIVDDARQWLVSGVGIAEPWQTSRGTPLSHSIGTHVVETGAPLRIDDARTHPVLADTPIIRELGIVAYLGVPLAHGAQVLGALAVFAAEPRPWTTAELELLTEFGRLAVIEIGKRLEALHAAHVATQQDAVLARIPSAVISCDAETGRLLTWNALAERLWGPRPGSLDHWRACEPSVPLRTQDGAPVAPDQMPLYRASRFGETIARREFRVDTAEGEARTVRITALPVIANEGTRIGAVMIADDVTEEVAATRRLAEEEERLRALHASSPVGIFESDLTGRVTRANPRLLQIWETTDEAILGTGWTARVHPQDLPALAKSWEAALLAPTEYEHEYRLQLDDGAIRWVHGRSAPLYDAQHVVIGSVGTIEDVTERRTSQDQLLQAQKMEAVGRLAGGIAHDFNNLLTAIRADSEFLIAALPRGSQERTDAEHIREATDRAAGLTRQLLAYSRRQLLQLRVLDPNAVVRGVEKLIGRLLDGDVRIVTALDDTVARITADPGQLEQVLVNLSINARDAMPSGGTLTIATRSEAPNTVVITVTDDGVGMDEQTVRRAFEPFFTTKSPERGTGLGLAMVHGVVTQSGGTVAIESTPGVGTRITMRFPATTERLPEPAPVLSAPVESTGCVLLVEDESLVRSAVRRLLSAQGYEVTEAADGLSAIDAWRQARAAGRPFDVVVTDLQMPEIDGGELARRLREEDASVPILFLTGHTDRPLPQELLDTGRPGTGRAALLHKPFSRAELARAIQSVRPVATQR